MLRGSYGVACFDLTSNIINICVVTLLRMPPSKDRSALALCTHALPSLLDTLLCCYVDVEEYALLRR